MSDIAADDQPSLLPGIGGVTPPSQSLIEPIAPPLPASPILVFDTIRRRKFSILFTTLIALLCGGSVIATLPQHYLASASIMIVDRKSELTVLPSQAGVFSSETVAARTQVDLLRSPALQRQVVNALDLQKAPEFARLIHPAPTQWRLFATQAISAVRRALRLPAKPLDTNFNDVVAATAILNNKTNIVNDGRSYVIDIQVRTEDPALGPLIANTLANKYLVLKTNLKSDALQRANTRFDARLLGLQNRMRDAERAVAEYRAQNGLIEDRAATGLGGVTPAAQQLAQLGIQLAAASSESARIEATIAQIRNAGHNGDLSTVPEVIASTLIERLHEQEATLSSQEADLAVTHGPHDPGLMAVRAAKADVARKIAGEVGRIIASLTTAAEAARNREASVRSSLEALKAQVAGEGRSSVRLMTLQSEADAARSLYTSVLDRAQQTANEVDMQEPDAVLISTAFPAMAPAMPTRSQLAMLVLGGSPMLALFIALVRDRLRPGLRSAEAVEALTGLPCLGLAPRRRGRRSERAFNAAVAGLPAMLGQARPKVLLLTSSVPGEGTSELAEALARNVAQTGDQVLLVICGTGPAPSVMPQPNLEIITAMPPALPQAARQNYDMIILDTPAVLASSKTLPLVGIAEATVLVVRFGSTPSPIVLRAIRLLRRHQARLAGTVITYVQQRELSAADGSDLYLDRRNRTSLGRAAVRWR